MICRHCKSKNLKFEKWIYEGKKQTQFHYIARCNDCKKHFFLPRNKSTYELTKDSPWKKTDKIKLDFKNKQMSIG